MKKKLALFTMILFMSLQPLSLNSNLGLAKETPYASTEDCNDCANKVPLKLEQTGKLNNQKVINNIKKSLRNNEEFKVSSHKQGDFDWNAVEFFDYGKNKNGIIVSHKKNDQKTDIRLLTAYDKNTYEVSDVFIMKSVAEGNLAKTSYTYLDGKEFVKFTIDMKTAKIIDIQIPQTETATGLFTVNKASAAGYPSRVVDCVKSYWKNASGFTKTFCSGACGSVIFGGNAFGVAMCASCLGASALSCLIEEA